MAQIHALLYLSESPLSAEEIAEQLSLARSNVSTSLRELQVWGIVRVTHRLGVRRDYFQAEGDVWEMFLRILNERKKREIDPTLDMLRECLAEQEQSHADATFVNQQMRNLLELLEMLVIWYEQMRRLPQTVQRRMLKMGSRLGEIVSEVRQFQQESSSGNE
jgi:DNA-binding transcriptional regulator GbsR (MarR family)